MRFKDVIQATGLSRSSIYNRLDSNHRSFDPDFPQPSSYGPRLVVWKESEIADWIEKIIISNRH